VRARQIATNITDETINAQRAGHYPTLGLSASYNNSINNNFNVFNAGGIDLVELESNSMNYGLQLNIPIYSGGRTSSLTRQASYFHNAALDDLEAEQRAAMRQTKNSYNAIEAGIEEVQALKQALISAKSSLEATQAGFEVGTRTIVDVLIAEQSYWRSAQNYSTARHTYILSHLALRQATGILNRDDLETVNTLLQTAEVELLPADNS
jgi:outer membrane protein